MSDAKRTSWTLSLGLVLACVVATGIGETLGSDSVHEAKELLSTRLSAADSSPTLNWQLLDGMLTSRLPKSTYSFVKIKCRVWLSVCLTKTWLWPMECTTALNKYAYALNHFVQKRGAKSGSITERYTVVVRINNTTMRRIQYHGCSPTPNQTSEIILLLLCGQQPRIKLITKYCCTCCVDGLNTPKYCSQILRIFMPRLSQCSKRILIPPAVHMPDVSEIHGTIRE